jgi:hypothetical protein
MRTHLLEVAVDAESLVSQEPQKTRGFESHVSENKYTVYYLRSVKRERNLAVFIRIVEKILVEILKLIS